MRTVRHNQASAREYLLGGRTRQLSNVWEDTGSVTHSAYESLDEGILQIISERRGGTMVDNKRPVKINLFNMWVSHSDFEERTKD